MSFLMDHFDAVASGIAPVVIAGFSYLFRAKVKLRYIIAHDFTFLVNEPVVDAEGKMLSPNKTIHTRALVLKNFGSKSAKKVKVTFNFKPQHMNLWPPRPFVPNFDDNNRYTIELDELVPKEPLTIEALMVNSPLPDALSVRHDGGLGDIQGMTIYPTVPKWRLCLALVAMFLGAWTALYYLIRFGMYCVGLLST